MRSFSSESSVVQIGDKRYREVQDVRFYAPIRTEDPVRERWTVLCSELEKHPLQRRLFEELNCSQYRPEREAIDESLLNTTRWVDNSLTAETRTRSDDTSGERIRRQLFTSG